MNDRFTFRAKSIDNNKFIYGYLCFIYIDNEKHCKIYSPDDAMSYDCYTETLGQCTGLKDRNGTLIYAGDILGNKDFMSDVALLKYNNEKCCYILVRQNVDDHFNKWWADRLMIIGNIHENKDLLKWQKIFLI